MLSIFRILIERLHFHPVVIELTEMGIVASMSSRSAPHSTLTFIAEH